MYIINAEVSKVMTEQKEEIDHSTQLLCFNTRCHTCLFWQQKFFVIYVESVHGKDGQTSSSIQGRCVSCCETCCKMDRPKAHEIKCQSRLGRKTWKRCTSKRSEATKQKIWYGTPTGLENGVEVYCGENWFLIPRTSYRLMRMDESWRKLLWKSTFWHGYTYLKDDQFYCLENLQNSLMLQTI